MNEELNEINNVFISVKFDSMNIKDASVWGIGISWDKGNEKLYIEPQQKRSDKLPKEVFMRMFSESYFMGLSEADAIISGVLDSGERYPINIFTTNDNKKLIEKVRQYFQKIYETNQKPIRFVFENSYDYILFLNSCFDFDENGFIKLYENIIQAPFIMETVCSTLNVWDEYLKAKDNFLKASEEGLNVENEQAKQLFVKLLPITEAMFIGDFYKLFFNNNND